MTLSIQKQASGIRARYPKARISFYEAEGGQCLDVSLTLQCLPIYAAFVVRLRYIAGSNPFVEVLDPTLVKQIDGQPTPHLNPDGSLCLVDPDNREWSPDRMIADRTLPWVERWLFHYENWLSSKEWLGDTIPSVANAETVLEPPGLERPE